jgi:hypothetical protein
LSLGLSGSVTCPAQTDQWTLECKVYRVFGNFDGDISLTDPIWSGIGDTEAEADPMKWIRRLNQDASVSVFNIANLTDMGGSHLIVDATGWSWNGSPEPPKSKGLPGVEMVAAPKVTSVFGQGFAVAMNPSEGVEYFEKQADGSYRVQKSGVETGLAIGSALIERGPSERVILHDFEVTVSTITDREPIEGTSLDIGKPIVTTRIFKKTFSIKPGLKYGLRIYFEKYGTLLVQIQLNLD